MSPAGERESQVDSLCVRFANKQPLDFTATQALIMGLGRFGGGLGAARYLHAQGAQVTVTDSANASQLAQSLQGLDSLELRTVLGGHDAADFDRADLVVVNPAVPKGHPLLERARRNGALVTSEIELALAAFPGRCVGVTGTQGKSSTCSMLAQLLELAGERVHLVGNIGGSFLERTPHMQASDVAVIELSSYQLESLAERGPHRERLDAAGITNVLVDHIERHGSLAAYARAKARITELVQKSATVIAPLNLPPAVEQRLPKQSLRLGQGARLAIRDDSFYLDEERLGRVSDLALPGAFQRPNALLALGLARSLGVPAAVLARSLPRLVGLPHRMQDLGRIGTRRVWDNGVSTTPDSTAAALESLSGPCLLLCGGRFKQAPLNRLEAAARNRVRLAICFGEGAGELSASLTGVGIACVEVANFADAVELSLGEGRSGEDLLFSPACSSFDAFPNFQTRARQFQAMIEAARQRKAASRPS